MASRGPSVIAELLVIRNFKRAECASVRKRSQDGVFKLTVLHKCSSVCQAENVQCIAPLPMALSNPQ